MHRRRIVSADSERLVTVAAHPLLQFGMRNSRKQGRIRDLVSVQVKYLKHRALGGRIEKFIGMPTGGQRTGLSLAVANYAGNNQIWIVEGSAKCVDKRVA